MSGNQSPQLYTQIVELVVASPCSSSGLSLEGERLREDSILNQRDHKNGGKESRFQSRCVISLDKHGFEKQMILYSLSDNVR